MMRSTMSWTAAAVGAFASAAAGQTATVSLIASNTTPAFGETFRVDVRVDFTGGVGLSLLNLRIRAEQPGLVFSNGFRGAGFFEFAGSTTTVTSNEINLVGGNLPPSFIPGNGDLFTGGVVFSFDAVLDFSTRLPIYDFSVSASNPAREVVGLFTSLTSTSGSPVLLPDSAVTLNGLRIAIPTPASAGLLAFGGLVAARRRRG